MKAQTPVLAIIDEGTVGHEALAEVLGAGFEVHFASGAAEGLEALERLERPVVLVPQALEPEAGDAVLGALARHGARFVGVLMVDDAEARFEEAGVHVVIVRPVQPELLRRQVAGAARLRGEVLRDVREGEALKGDFAALREHLRHDLRGRLQGVIGLSSFLKDEFTNPQQDHEEMREFCERIFESGQRLVGFVDGLAAWVTVASRELAWASVEVGALMQEIWAEATLGGGCEPDSRFIFDWGKVKIQGDEQVIGLGLRALVAFGRERGTERRVVCSRAGGEVLMTVQDPTARALTVEEFERAVRPFSREGGGPEFGLAVVAKMAERHGGAFVGSCGEHGGNVWTLRLKRRA